LTVSTFCGHASIRTTYNVYGQLFRGKEAEARDLMDVYLDEHDG
jgi:integrase